MEQFRIDKPVERFGVGAAVSLHPAIVSAILGRLPRTTVAGRPAAPTAVAYARSSLRDSHLVARLQKTHDLRKLAEGNRQPRRDTALFQSVGIPYGKLPALERMSPVEKDIETGFLGNCASGTCERSAKQLVDLIREETPRGFTRLVSAVNAGVNRLVRYQPDRTTYRQLDFWANPSTTLNRGAGDCEDYAILKMALLAEAGVPRSAMSIVVLRDQRRNVYHAVLSVRTTQGNFILDNVRETVLPDRELPDYVPLYSVSSSSSYIYGRPTGGSRMVASLQGLDGIAPGEGQDIGLPVPLPAGMEELPLSTGPR